MNQMAKLAYRRSRRYVDHETRNLAVIMLLMVLPLPTAATLSSLSLNGQTVASTASVAPPLSPASLASLTQASLSSGTNVPINAVLPVNASTLAASLQPQAGSGFDLVNPNSQLGQLVAAQYGVQGLPAVYMPFANGTGCITGIGCIKHNAQGGISLSTYNVSIPISNGGNSADAYDAWGVLSTVGVSPGLNGCATATGSINWQHVVTLLIVIAVSVATLGAGGAIASSSLAVADAAEAGGAALADAGAAGADTAFSVSTSAGDVASTAISPEELGFSSAQEYQTALQNGFVFENGGGGAVEISPGDVPEVTPAGQGAPSIFKNPAVWKTISKGSMATAKYSTISAGIVAVGGLLGMFNQNVANNCVGLHQNADPCLYFGFSQNDYLGSSTGNVCTDIPTLNETSGLVAAVYGGQGQDQWNTNSHAILRYTTPGQDKGNGINTVTGISFEAAAGPGGSGLVHADLYSGDIYKAIAEYDATCTGACDHATDPFAAGLFNSDPSAGVKLQASTSLYLRPCNLAQISTCGPSQYPYVNGEMGDINWTFNPYLYSGDGESNGGGVSNDGWSLVLWVDPASTVPQGGTPSSHVYFSSLQLGVQSQSIGAEQPAGSIPMVPYQTDNGTSFNVSAASGTRGTNPPTFTSNSETGYAAQYLSNYGFYQFSSNLGIPSSGGTYGCTTDLSNSAAVYAPTGWLADNLCQTYPTALSQSPGNTAHAQLQTPFSGSTGYDGAIGNGFTASCDYNYQLGQQNEWDVGPLGEPLVMSYAMVNTPVAGSNCTGVSYVGPAVSQTAFNAFDVNTILFGYQGSRNPITGTLGLPSDILAPSVCAGCTGTMTSAQLTALAAASSVNVTWGWSYQGAVFSSPMSWSIPVHVGQLGFSHFNTGTTSYLANPQYDPDASEMQSQQYLFGNDGCASGGSGTELAFAPDLIGQQAVWPFNTVHGGGFGASVVATYNTTVTGPSYGTGVWNCVPALYINYTPSMPLPTGFSLYGAGSFVDSSGNHTFSLGTGIGSQLIFNGNYLQADIYSVKLNIPGFSVRNVVGPIGLTGVLYPYDYVHQGGSWSPFANSTGSWWWQTTEDVLNNGLGNPSEGCGGYANSGVSYNTSAFVFDCVDPGGTPTGGFITSATPVFTPNGYSGSYRDGSVFNPYHYANASAFTFAVPKNSYTGPGDYPTDYAAGQNFYVGGLAWNFTANAAGGAHAYMAPEFTALLYPGTASLNVYQASTTNCTGGMTNLTFSGFRVCLPSHETTATYPVPPLGTTNTSFSGFNMRLQGGHPNYPNATIPSDGFPSNYVSSNQTLRIRSGLWDDYTGALNANCGGPSVSGDYYGGSSNLALNTSSPSGVTNDPLWWGLGNNQKTPGGGTDAGAGILCGSQSPSLGAVPNVDGYYAYDPNVGSLQLPLGAWNFTATLTGAIGDRWYQHLPWQQVFNVSANFCKDGANPGSAAANASACDTSLYTPWIVTVNVQNISANPGGLQQQALPGTFVSFDLLVGGNKVHLFDQFFNQTGCNSGASLCNTTVIIDAPLSPGYTLELTDYFPCPSGSTGIGGWCTGSAPPHVYGYNDSSWQSSGTQHQWMAPDNGFADYWPVTFGWAWDPTYCQMSDSCGLNGGGPSLGALVIQSLIAAIVVAIIAIAAGAIAFYLYKRDLLYTAIGVAAGGGVAATGAAFYLLPLAYLGVSASLAATLHADGVWLIAAGAVIIAVGGLLAFDILHLAQGSSSKGRSKSGGKSGKSRYVKAPKSRSSGRKRPT